MPNNCAAIVIAAKHHELSKVKDTRGTTNTVGALRCKFNFRTDDWLHSTKTAMFCNGDAVLHPEVIDNAIAVPLDSDDECAVPYEVLTDTLPYSIGVWGVTDTGLRVVSNWLVFGAQVGCFAPGTAPSDPEPTMYEQILLTAQDALNTANEVAERADRGEFNGQSAYELAVELGYEGSEAEWLDSLKGDDGKDGTSVTIVSSEELNDGCIFALGLCEDGSIGEKATLTGFNFGSNDKIMTINGKEFTAVDGKWIYNEAATASDAASYSMIIYDKGYTGTFTTNNYGAAIVLDANGKLVKIYDGANVGYYTEEGKATSAHFTSSTYATVAFSELTDRELLIIFPNDGGTNTARGFALGLRFDGSIGQTATLTGFEFGPIDKTIAINGKTFTAVDGKWLYNRNVTSSTAQNYHMIIYDKNYAGTFTTNSYGAAIVLDSYGKLIKIYDGANSGYYTEEGKAASAHFTSSTYATVAFSELTEGELLVIFPNDGGTNEARSFALGLRFDGSIGKIATLTGFTFKTDSKILTINDNVFEAEPGDWLYNTGVTSDSAEDYSMLIFDKSYEGSVTTVSHGVAIVLDERGNLIKIYDGANVKYYTTEGVSDFTHFTEDTFATVAFSELEDGELLVVFPNDKKYVVVAFSDGNEIKIKNGGASSSGPSLPSYDSANEGQFLMIVNGAPTWTTISTSTVSYDGDTRTLSITTS